MKQNAKEVINKKYQHRKQSKEAEGTKETNKKKVKKEANESKEIS